MVGRLEVILFHELMATVEPLEEKATTTGGFKHRDSSTGFVARMEEHIKSLENSQQAII